MVFCNIDEENIWARLKNSHNPYFSRWFSAIKQGSVTPISGYGHNPYFSRWFSAIKELYNIRNGYYRHNPYFSRWFSAIDFNLKSNDIETLSQSLF